MKRAHILDLSPTELAGRLGEWGEPKFRAEQIRQWLYQRKVLDPLEMTNLSRNLRDRLKEEFDTSLPPVVSRLDSEDGTSKFLLRSEKGHVLEVVLMRYKERTSLCVSSQVGCRLACRFCQTGKMGFVRHLSQSEILSQYLLAEQVLRQEGDGRRVSHVVFMGMGEPFDNYDAAVGAANTLISPEGFGLSARHVTLSTSGMVPRIYQLAHDSRAALAISLHAATDDLRTRLMPINRRYPLKALKEALVAYQKATNAKLTIEYILIHGENTRVADAKALVKFIHGLRVKVNLIPFNSHPGMPYQRPGAEEIREFQQYLSKRSIPAPVRYSKGLDVSGACGQLAAKVAGNLESEPSRSNIVG